MMNWGMGSSKSIRFILWETQVHYTNCMAIHPLHVKIWRIESNVWSGGVSTGHEVTKTDKVPALGRMNVLTKFHGNLPNRLKNIKLALWPSGSTGGKVMVAPELTYCTHSVA